MDNNHEGWAQGYFVDQPKYRHWSQAEKDKANECEKLKVRPSPEGNAICHCSSPEEAEWIVSRLNLAAKLEKHRRCITGLKAEIAQFQKRALNIYTDGMDSKRAWAIVRDLAQLSAV